MLAEIFMMRLEADRRLAQEVPPSSASRLIPFSPKSQFAFKKANQGVSERRAACKTGPIIRAGTLR